MTTQTIPGNRLVRCWRIYNNGDISKWNVRSDELEEWLDFLAKFRPGVAVLVEGDIKQKGYLSNDRLAEFAKLMTADLVVRGDYPMVQCCETMIDTKLVARTPLTGLAAVSAQLKSQDNRMTQNPMFCVQIKVRDVGYDANYSDHCCWRDSANEITIYDDDPGFEEPTGSEWDKFGYVDRWETIMVAFTEAGCEEYLRLDGHNVRHRAYKGEVRIYVESWNRCPEMIAIREALLALA